VGEQNSDWKKAGGGQVETPRKKTPLGGGFPEPSTEKDKKKKGVKNRRGKTRGPVAVRRTPQHPPRKKDEPPEKKCGRAGGGGGFWGPR